MQVIITGGQGFVGRELCRYLLRKGELRDSAGTMLPITGVTLFDTVSTGGNLCDPRVTYRCGDITDASVCQELVEGEGPLSVFHMAGIMSGQGEKDFDLCLRVNLDGTRNLLEASRHRTTRLQGDASKVKFIFASTGAAFGETYGPADEPTGDTTKLVPLNTYGMTKTCCELLVNDYTRKGFIDGRSARLPTVIVRPGAPNAATTSCYSGVIREPLHGVDVVLPIARNLPHAVTSTRALLYNLGVLHDARWPEGLVDRSVTLPSNSITLQGLIDALYQAVPKEQHAKLGKITDNEDPFLSKVVGGMGCKRMSQDRAMKLGMVAVPSLSTIVTEFLEDFGEKAVVSVPSQQAGTKREITSDALAAQPPLKVARVDAADSVAKIAVITGAGSGIGREVAVGLVSLFTNVVLMGRRAEALQETQKLVEKAGGNATVIPADVSSPMEVERAFALVREIHGRIDLLFNNAGTNCPQMSLEDIPFADWQSVVAVNLTGPFLCMQQAFKLMKSQSPPGGRIINNGSVSSVWPRPHAAPYNATKHAISGLTKTAALDGRGKGIAVGQIDIGNARSAMTSRQAGAGSLQPNGTKKQEACMDVSAVVRSVVCMAALPPEANVHQLTVMATEMPLLGRG